MRALLVVVTEETIKQKALEKTIKKKRESFLRYLAEFEELKNKLDSISTEYNSRIGNLYIQDNILDLEIIMQKKINMLMNRGLSYKDAIAEVQKEGNMKNKENLKESESFFYIEDDDEEVVEKDNGQLLKNLWKKLVQKFHPDLATDNNDRRDREKIMKKINHAYKHNDEETLSLLYQREYDEATEGAPLEVLEQIYIRIENQIVHIQVTIADLKQSQWYGWLKKETLEKEKLLRSMENEIRDEILTKHIILRNLKRIHNII